MNRGNGANEMTYLKLYEKKFEFATKSDFLIPSFQSNVADLRYFKQ